MSELASDALIAELRELAEKRLAEFQPGTLEYQQCGPKRLSARLRTKTHCYPYGQGSA